MVADVLEQPVLVLQLEVVPVLAAHEYAAVPVLQFELVQALEDLREGLALLEVLAAIVGTAGEALAAIVFTDQLGVGVTQGPAGANAEGTVELAFDLAGAEGHAVCRQDQATGQAHCQRQPSATPGHWFIAHDSYLFVVVWHAGSFRRANESRAKNLGFSQEN
ncbi:hypothetical protein D3C76_1110210 [compost metagenome]